jgi:ABC-type antimicrobial peptide transport system permease subunit
MLSIRDAIRLFVSLALGLLSGYGLYWGVLRLLAAPFEREYGPNVFAEDANVGITMGLYMIGLVPVAVIVGIAVCIVAFIVCGRCWVPKQSTLIQHQGFR